MKRLMKTIMGAAPSARALLSLLAVAMPFGISSTARADAESQVCGPEILNGSYVFTASGFNIIGGVPQPKAILEGIDFNGDGTLVSPFATVSLNGVIIRSSGSVGTYTVEANCQGTLTFTNGPSFDIFVGRKAKQLWMIQTGPDAVPAVFQGTTTKVSR